MVKPLEVAERDQLITSICQGVMDDELDFATAVRRLRVEVTGLNQAPFARMCRISLGALLQLEHGTGNPTLKTLDSVFRVFGLRLSLALRSAPYR